MMSLSSNHHAINSPLPPLWLLSSKPTLYNPSLPILFLILHSRPRLICRCVYIPYFPIPTLSLLYATEDLSGSMFLITNKPISFQFWYFAKLDTSNIINLILFLFSIKDPYFVLCSSEKNYIYSKKINWGYFRKLYGKYVNIPFFPIHVSKLQQCWLYSENRSTLGNLATFQFKNWSSGLRKMAQWIHLNSDAQHPQRSQAQRRTHICNDSIGRERGGL